MKFQAPAILTSLSYTKDNGLRLGFTTNELSHEDRLTASKFYQSFGYVLFKENEFKDEDIPESDATDESKSPSQRLRATLFVYWKQRMTPKPTFEQFYQSQMEKIIDRVKACLD